MRGRASRLLRPEGARRQIDQMADAIKAAGGPSADRRKIEAARPIGSTGHHSALVRLHTGVLAPGGANVAAAR